MQASKHTEDNYGSPDLAPVEVIVVTQAILANFSENQVFRHQAKKIKGTTGTGALSDPLL